MDEDFNENNFKIPKPKIRQFKAPGFVNIGKVSTIATRIANRKRKNISGGFKNDRNVNKRKKN